jgi:SAM-dependent methyltransferase
MTGLLSKNDTTASLCPSCGEPGGCVLLEGRDRFVGGPGEFSVVACGACGLSTTRPQIGPEDFGTYYPDDYTAYEPRPTGPDATLRSRLGALVDRLRIDAILRFGPYRPLLRRTPGRVLDVGCGVGDLAVALRRHGWSVTGLEPSAVACEHARGRGLEVHCGTLDDAPWDVATFDAIVFNHALEHIPQPEDALRRAAGLLRPGGMLAVAVPNFGCWQRRVFGSRWFQLDVPRHLQHFDRDSLAAVVSRAGLRPVEFRTASMRPGLLMSLQYAAFGRPVANGRGLRWAAWATAPLLVLSDLVAEGDCLHIFATR